MRAMLPLPSRLMLVAAVAIPLAAPVAFADAPDADLLFRQGRASADAGDYPHACVAFTESFRLDPAPGTMLNLADCEQHIGRLASAWGHFVHLEKVLPATDERREVARERATTLAPRVPWMTVVLAPDAPPDARVFRDDVEIDSPSLGLLLPVDPGSHTLLIVAPGRDARTMAVVAVEREVVRVVVSLGPSSPAAGVVSRVPAVLPDPVVAREVARPAPTHTAAWLVGAAGIASLGVGTYFGARALAERSISDGGCTGGVCSSAMGLQAYESARSDARVSDVALGIGIVGLAVGGYLLLRSGTDAPASTALRVTATGVGGAW
jgi:hypothetical protein